MLKDVVPMVISQSVVEVLVGKAVHRWGQIMGQVVLQPPSRNGKHAGVRLQPPMVLWEFQRIRIPGKALSDRQYPNASLTPAVRYVKSEPLIIISALRLRGAMEAVA